MMTNYDLLQAINALLCGIIVIRLVTFRRESATHKPAGGWLAYAIIVICASVPIRIAYGYHVSTDYADLLIKILLCGAVLKTRGNVMQLFTIAHRGKKRENFR
ncbi:phage holin family protein [Pantoea agglomerans]|uniref:phage holin family protein n=1 Tax=Enterobacter agglomerans TaxID=549 RepID=UPI003C7B1ED0